ncbi:AI-2E family transporter [Cellulomonas fengjieae]|uniref:AI-2E family transporter n=1 Tax=Cellulomonas fengjieae TaxID=2819978 RepID=A0ABS3SEA4_9CELL|nr:AI-2E family transporter [Cellulomonas fengjieae]MBO3084083.1 AI-2E family transporter [Cellulomonas fengjieae]QVI64661.1 AI-2E family transporter [Cellulomonas fengjieae]
MPNRSAPPVVLPATDPRKPPLWLPRALVMTAFAVFVAVAVWRALGMLSNVIFIIVISWFLSLAMEPLIRWLVAHGVRRTRATGIVMLGALVLIGVVIALFGGLFITQVIALAQSLPDVYDQLVVRVDESFGFQLPEVDELLVNLGDHWQELAPGLLGIGTSIVGGLFTFTSVLLVVYYMASAGPRFRASICRLLAPARQREILRLWEVSQEKVADFINSRIVLAALSTAITFVFLTVLGIPYALPLAAFTGVVSQFVPTIGTYIGGALPIAVALTVSPVKGLLTLAFIVGYQQVENLLFAPKVSARSMEINPAVAFLAVIGFGAVFGPIGAFLALPVAATIQAVSSTYIRRHELVDDELLREDDKDASAKDEDGDAEAADDRTGDRSGDRTGEDERPVAQP